MNDDLYATVSKLKKVPAIASALARGDLAALTNNPDINKAMRQLSSTSDPAEAEKLAKKLLNSAGGEQLKRMLDI